MSSILLISDFQNGSYKIGILKSEIYALFPNDTTIDITHNIRLNNTIEAAFICKQLPENPNAGNIYLHWVGSSKEIVAYIHQKNLYIFPNNGLLGMIFETLNQDEVYMLPTSDWLNCMLAFKKNQMNSLKKAEANLILSYNKSAQVNDSMAVAECLFIDGFGNCYFNFTETQFKNYIGESAFKIRIQHYLGQSFTRIGKHISDVSQGAAVFTFSRNGYLTLQINMGNAKQLFRIKDDTKIIIEKQ